MNVMVFGAYGMLGQYVCRYFKLKGVKVKGYGRDDFDIYQMFLENELYDLLDTIIPEDIVVINCAGITNKRQEVSLSEMYIVNSIFPMMLDKLCHTKHTHLIHISTDCVFSGKEGNYIMTDFPDETNNYGMSKNFGERLDHSMVIRTSIIGEEKTQHPLGLLEWVKNNKDEHIKGYTNHLWNGVTCLELAKFIYERITQNKLWNGIVHIVSETITKYDLVKLILETYDIKKDVEPFQTDNKCDKTLIGIKINKSLKEQMNELKDFNI